MLEDLDRTGLTHVAITPATTDQATGRRIPEVRTETPITGDLQDVTLERLARYPEGSVQAGDRVLFTAAHLAAGDQVQVTETDGTTTTWAVSDFAQEYRALARFIGTTRRRYLLKRIT